MAEADHHILIDKHNPAQMQALEIVRDTNASFFLTGRAGTGKTTFLHQTAMTDYKLGKPSAQIMIKAIKSEPRYIPFVQAIQQMMYSCAENLNCTHESIKAVVSTFNANVPIEPFLSHMEDKEYSLFVATLIRHFEDQNN